MKPDTRDFAKWTALLDGAVEASYGVCLLDLPDMPTRQWFDDGLTIQVALYRVHEGLKLSGYLS